MMIKQLLQTTVLELRWINFKHPKNEITQTITLLDIADKLSKEKRLMLSFINDMIPDSYSIDEQTSEQITISHNLDKFYIHLFYVQNDKLTLEYVNDSLDEVEWRYIRKMYYHYLNIKQTN